MECFLNQVIHVIKLGTKFNFNSLFEHFQSTYGKNKYREVCDLELSCGSSVILKLSKSLLCFFRSTLLEPVQ